MNLSPEARAIGKANFHAAIGDELTRRQFLSSGIAAGVVSGAGLGSFYFGYKKVVDPLRVGLIGTGDEGSVLIGAHTPDYLRIVAIADIRPYNIHRAFHGDVANPGPRPGLMVKYGWKTEDEGKKQVKVYGQDYHDLLKDPAVEAVIIALPLHLHDTVAIEAMHAGKHVLTEKLMGYSVHQCKEMARTSHNTQKILATGHQRHYSILYDNAVDMIRRNLLGKLHHIRAQWHRTADSWYQALPGEKFNKDLDEFKKKLAEAEAKGDMARIEALRIKVDDLLQRALDWPDPKDPETWVDAAKYGYKSKTISDGGASYDCTALEELIRWRLWNRTGGGLMAELGSHQLDASGIFCSAVRTDGTKALPLTVSAVGGRHLYPLDREVDDHVYCMFEYPGPDYDKDPNKKIVVTYSSINGSGFGGYGEVVMGTEGTLILEREQEVMLFKGSDTATNVSVGQKEGGVVLNTSATTDPSAAVGQKALETGPVSRGYTEEMEHFAWCVRNFDYKNNQPKCRPEVAMADAIIALTTNIAIRNQQRIEFKPEWFDVFSDETPEGVKPSVQAEQKTSPSSNA